MKFVQKCFNEIQPPHNEIIKLLDIAHSSVSKVEEFKSNEKKLKNLKKCMMNIQTSMKHHLITFQSNGGKQKICFANRSFIDDQCESSDEDANIISESPTRSRRLQYACGRRYSFKVCKKTLTSFHRKKRSIHPFKPGMSKIDHCQIHKMCWYKVLKTLFELLHISESTDLGIKYSSQVVKVPM